MTNKRRVTLSTIALAAALVRAANTAAPQSPKLAETPTAILHAQISRTLVVEALRTIPADATSGRPPGIAVVVRNVGDRTIVAAGIRTELRFVDDYVDRGGVSSDGVEFRTLPQSKPLIIEPDGLYTFPDQAWPSGRSERDVVSVKAEPTFVIFEDDTALGDEGEIRYHFKARENNHHAWPVIDAIFADAVARNPNPRQALVAAEADIAAIADDVVRNSAAFRWAQLMLSTNLKFTRPDDTPLLNSMLDEINVRRLANEQHYQRRK